MVGLLNGMVVLDEAGCGSRMTNFAKEGRNVRE